MSDLNRRISRRQAVGAMLVPLVAGCMPDHIFAPTEEKAQRLAQFAAVGTPVTLIGAGDVHALRENPASVTGAMMRQMLAATPSAIPFSLGDSAGDVGSVVDFQHYDLHWGSFKSRTRFQIGNHERKVDPSATAYYNYAGAAAGPRGKGYYAETLGNWRVYWMNSEVGQTAQAAWLEADLLAHRGLRKAAFFHKPLFVSNGHNPIGSVYVRPWWQIFVKYGVELAVSGHTHRYERFAPLLADGTRSSQGVRSFIVGTGGGWLASISAVHSASEVQAIERGIFRLVLRSDSFDWKFTDRYGVVRDHGTQLCRRLAA